MAHRLHVFCILALSLLLFGCGTTKGVVVMNEVKTQVIAADKSMFKVPETPKPSFTPEEYSVMTNEQKEAANIDLQHRLYKALKSATDTIKSLDEWTDRQKLLYQKE